MAITTRQLRYVDGDVPCLGVLAADNELTDKRPGILVFHEAFGLTDHCVERAQMLASLGYVALAADLFGNGQKIENIAEAMSTITAWRADPPRLRARAAAALGALAACSQVDAARMGAIGFCFGGSTALELARSGAKLAGVVCFHGQLSTTLPAPPGAIGSQVLVCVGADDPLIPAQQMSEFLEEMRQTRADCQLITYSGAAHSFTNPAADKAGIPGLAYDERTDHRSWMAMRTFFDEAFATRLP